MPELPEVETIVRELQPALTGKKLIKTNIFWHKTFEGDLKTLTHDLAGKMVNSVARRGKYILIGFGQDWHLTIHLRMTGRLLFKTVSRDKPYIRARFDFSNKCTLYFVDIRKFGKIRVWVPGDKVLPRLGPEPLKEKTVLDTLMQTTSRRPIKSLLLDQHFLAGIGNIYADESLFAAGIHPAAISSDLPEEKLKALSRHLPRILKAAIKNMGTTLSDYRTTENLQGKNQFFLQVYGRKDQPCRVCGSQIIRIRISNRSSHFCPKCQPEVLIERKKRPVL